MEREALLEQLDELSKLLAGLPPAPDVDAGAAAVIEGSGTELCLVAARRVAAGATGLTGRGPDAAAVLELVRTYV